MFRKAYTKLTIYYILIITIISIVFSLVIYKVSTEEINRSLGKQARAFQQIGRIQAPPMGGDPILEQMIEKQLIESRDNLIKQLIYFNLIILVLAGFGSYFFAKKTLEPIEEMVDSQSRFTADAAHELRTPLSAIRSEIEVSLRDKKLGLPEAKALLLSNLEEVDKLETLSNALLKLANYEKETKESFSKLKIGDVLADAYQKIEKLANEKNITFDNNIVDFSFEAEKQSITELFVILLENAIKYSPPESQISIKSYAEKERRIIEISDEGIGIKSSDLPYIFNRFFRADHSRTKNKVNGYGLGLAIAKQIIDLHGGQIEVKSKLDKGSEFKVIL